MRLQTGHDASLSAITVRDTRVCTADKAGTVKLWAVDMQAATVACVATVDLGLPRGIGHVALSPDFTVVAATSWDKEKREASLLLWDIASSVPRQLSSLPIKPDVKPSAICFPSAETVVSVQATHAVAWHAKPTKWVRSTSLH